MKKQEQVNKNEIEKLIESNKNEIERMRIQNQNEIEKINVQLIAQGKLYEQNAQTDFTKEFMSKLLSDPQNAGKSLTAMMEIMKSIDNK